MPNARPITGNTNRLIAPSARIAAIAYDASSSSASIAPLAAMMADTPQIDDPIANRLISFGGNRNARPSAVMITIATASSSATQTRLTPPSLTTSPSRNRTPSNTIPTFSQNSYVSTPRRNSSGTPTVFETIRPKMMAHRTYSMLGSVIWWARPNDAIDCSVTFPANPIATSSSVPGTSALMRVTRESPKRGRS